MSTYTVAEARKKKDVGDSKQVIVLKLSGAEAGDGVQAEWLCERSQVPPAPGSTIEGDLKNDPEWGWKFWPPRRGNQGSGFKKGSDTPSIERQKSAAIAGDMLIGFMGTGWKPESVDALGDIFEKLYARVHGKVGGAA